MQKHQEIPSPMESIRAENVVKDFGAVRALDGISLEVRPGELFFLLGASGCGTTTLLRCIAGLETPTSGAGWFGERDVTRMPPHKREAVARLDSLRRARKMRTVVSQAE